MPKGQKKEANVVKIQVEAKTPRRKAAKIRAVGGKVPKQLLENTVALQKVYADIALKLDRLSDKISSLLNLFEAAAKSFSESPACHTAERDREFLEKINQLIEQDKLIAKGIIYIEEKLGERAPEIAPSPMSQVTAPPAMPRPPSEKEGFQPSMIQPGKPLSKP